MSRVSELCGDVFHSREPTMDDRIEHIRVFCKSVLVGAETHERLVEVVLAHVLDDVDNGLVSIVDTARQVERDRCAKIADAEGPCCINQKCHAHIAHLIRSGEQA